MPRDSGHRILECFQQSSHFRQRRRRDYSLVLRLGECIRVQYPIFMILHRSRCAWSGIFYEVTLTMPVCLAMEIASDDGRFLVTAIIVRTKFILAALVAALASKDGFGSIVSVLALYDCACRH